MGEPILSLRLDRLRCEGDPAADAAVAALGRNAWSVSLLLRETCANDEPLPAGVPAHLEPLVRPALPPWADLARIRSAQRFAERHLTQITVALFCASLPASYAAAEGARVLAATGRLRRDVDRRVNETACFVLEVLRPHGLEPGGRARIAIGKVRLIHAAVRRSLAASRLTALESPPGREGEVAINQEDMLGTLGLFSLLVIDSLERLGMPVDPRDAEDYLHLWCVVGEMLGVSPALLPRDVVSARSLFATIRRRQHAPSEHGRALMRELLDGMERHARAPGLSQAPRHLVHYLLGAEVAGDLGIEPPSPAWKRRAELGARLLGRSPLAATAGALSAVLGRQLLETITRAKLGHGAVTLPIPAIAGLSPAPE